MKQKTIKETKIDENLIQDSWSKLSKEEQKLVSNFLCLREMCYDQFAKMSDSCKNYLNLLFPEVSK